MSEAALLLLAAGCALAARRGAAAGLALAAAAAALDAASLGGLGARTALRAALFLGAPVACAWAANRAMAARLETARRTWTALRAVQLGEYFSLALFQLRDYLISLSSTVEAFSLMLPKDPPALGERAEKLKRVVAELNGKCGRLLGDASPVTTQPREPISAFALADAARGAVEEAKRAFATEPVPVSVLVERDGQLSCDRRSLRIALLALLQNSLEACARRGQGAITVTCRYDGRRAQLEITDDGGGIAAPETAFEPLHSARHGGGGLGLGLSMSRRLIERLGGSLRAKTGDGCTAVLIELPVAMDLPFVRNEESTWAGRRGQP